MGMIYGNARMLMRMRAQLGTQTRTGIPNAFT